MPKDPKKGSNKRFEKLKETLVKKKGTMPKKGKK